MCKDCIKMHELTHDEENLITVAKCNGLICEEFFIIPMYGAYVKHNEIKEVSQFSNDWEKKYIWLFDIYCNEHLTKLKNI